MGYSTRDRGNYRTPAPRPAVCRLASNKPPSLRDDGGQTRDLHMVCWQSSRATSRIILAAARACFPCGALLRRYWRPRRWQWHWLASRDSWDLPRGRWDPPKKFQVSGLQLFDLARHLVLTGGELLYSLPQRAQIPRHVLHLVHVDGWVGDRFRRDRIRRALRNRCRLRCLPG
jgi:hypothetical protein